MDYYLDNLVYNEDGTMSAFVYVKGEDKPVGTAHTNKEGKVVKINLWSN